MAIENKNLNEGIFLNRKDLKKILKFFFFFPPWFCDSLWFFLCGYFPSENINNDREFED